MLIFPEPKPGAGFTQKWRILNAPFVIRIGFEPMTYCLEGSCSIQLSYRTKLLLWSAKLRKLCVSPNSYQTKGKCMNR